MRVRGSWQVIFDGGNDDLAQDLFFEAGGFVRVGIEASFVLDPGTGLIGVEPGSEFGLYPNLLFATARFYF